MILVWKDCLLTFSVWCFIQILDINGGYNVKNLNFIAQILTDKN